MCCVGEIGLDFYRTREYAKTQQEIFIQQMEKISRFAELEVLMDKYFHQHIAPIMKETRAYLIQKQGEEMREYSTSAAGILSSMASLPGTL